GKIWKALVAYGYLTPEGRVVATFQGLEKPFKDAFPAYGDKEFKKIQDVLIVAKNSFKQALKDYDAATFDKILVILQQVRLNQMFSEAELDADHIVPALIKHGYVIAEGRVADTFKEIEQSFKDEFPLYGEPEFKEMLLILQREQDMGSARPDMSANQPPSAPLPTERPAAATPEAERAVALAHVVAAEERRAGWLLRKWKALGVKVAWLKAKITGHVDSAQAVGGINLSDEHLAITLKVDGEGMPLPAELQDPALINIQGLMPVIRDVSPVSAENMPVLADLMALASRS
ncbi:MAG: hypothetical protein HQL19_05515, partial [Candidatus Omnitrophica bacterium]|nr:hypothetical protein [Candidatus Omnitrophota bacterium]